MMGQGFILVYRQMMENPLWLSEPFTRAQAWIDLLFLANHSDSYFRVRGVRVDIRRGQVGRSSVTLAERWRWSRGKVNRFLNELENDQQIVQQKTNVTTLISIVNYEKYQGSQAAGGTAKKTASRQQASSKQTQINNVNNVNNKTLDQSEPSAEISSKEKFEKFWEVWPRKDARLDAKKAFDKLEPDDDLLQAMIDAIIKTSATDQWQNKKYIPLPATWIRGERWNDEIELPPGADDSQKRSPGEWQHVAAKLGIERWQPGGELWPEWKTRVMAAEQRKAGVAV